MERQVASDEVEFNKQFTRHPQLDAQINEVLRLMFRDFITPWHRPMSLGQEFPCNLYNFIHYTISSLARRLEEVNVSNLVLNKLLDELIKHIRLYRISKAQLAYKAYSEGVIFRSIVTNLLLIFVTIFFL